MKTYRYLYLFLFCFIVMYLYIYGCTFYFFTSVTQCSDFNASIYCATLHLYRFANHECLDSDDNNFKNCQKIISNQFNMLRLAYISGVTNVLCGSKKIRGRLSPFRVSPSNKSYLFFC